MRITVRWGLLSLGLLILAVGSWALAAEPAATEAARGASMDQLMPQWNLGDGWVVETVTAPVQVRGDRTQWKTQARPIQWQFAVQKYEKVINDDCYRVEVRCLEDGPSQPVTVLWIDKQSRTLRQIETQFPVAGELRTVVENYQFSSGQPAPVLTPLTALPVELPVFQGDQAKGLQTYSYQVSSGPAGTKALGELDFAYQVEQEVNKPEPDHVKGLVADSFAKDVAVQETVEVRIKGFDRQVRQLWQKGLPWPVYSDNGTTVSRLVKFNAAGGDAQQN